MTQEECSRLLAVIAARYPTSRLWEQEAALTARAWHMSLDDVTYPAAERFLKDWFKSEKWPPDPSEIRDGVDALIRNCRTDEERESLEPGWRAWRDSQRRERAVLSGARGELS